MTKDMPEEVWVNAGAEWADQRGLYIHGKGNATSEQTRYIRADLVTPAPSQDRVEIFEDIKKAIVKGHYSGAVTLIEKFQQITPQDIAEAASFMEYCISTDHVDYIHYRNILIRAALQSPRPRDDVYSQTTGSLCDQCGWSMVLPKYFDGKFGDCLKCYADSRNRDDVNEAASWGKIIRDVLQQHHVTIQSAAAIVALDKLIAAVSPKSDGGA